MAIFWIPLAMCIMAVPVLDALTDKEKRRDLLPGAILFGSLALAVVIARFAWASTLGGAGAALALLAGAAVVGALNLQDRSEKFSLPNLASAWSQGLKGSSRIELALFALPFLLVAAVFYAGQNQSHDPVTASFFSEINVALMQQQAGKIIPSALLLALTCTAAFLLPNSKRAMGLNALLLAGIACVDLYVTDSPSCRMFHAPNTISQITPSSRPSRRTRPMR